MYPPWHVIDAAAGYFQNTKRIAVSKRSKKKIRKKPDGVVDWSHFIKEPSEIYILEDAGPGWVKVLCLAEKPG